MQLDSYSVLLWGRPLSVVILPPFSFHFSRPLVYVLEDAVHGLCSCSSFSGSCFRPFRRYVSFRNFCVGGQSIHVTFSTRAADMYTDMPRVDRGATATSGIRAQNEYWLTYKVIWSVVRSAYWGRGWWKSSIVDEESGFGGHNTFWVSNVYHFVHRGSQVAVTFWQNRNISPVFEVIYH